MDSQTTGPGDRHASRRARTDAKLTTAVNHLLARQGYAALTIESVARESGVAKTTIYRRWSSKAEMVFELMIHLPSGRKNKDNKSDNMRDGLRELAENAVEMISSPSGLAVIPGLLADMQGNEGLRSTMNSLFVKKAQQDIASTLSLITSNAVDINEFHATLLGVPYFQIHVLNETDKNRIIEQLTDHLLLLVKRGS